MPSYTYKCLVCDKIFDSYSLIDNRNNPQICECGGKANRDVESEINTSYNIAGTSENHERYSMSLGVLDEDLPAARTLHPQAEWKKFGNSWRPLIRNRAEKIKIMKQARMVEYD